MAISKDGDFQDEEQFRAFGSLLRKTFGTPLASLDHPAAEDGRYRLTLPERQKIRYVSIREDIAEGQRIRGFRLLADGRTVYESACVGHRRIVPFEDLSAGEIALEITAQSGNASLRDLAVYG